MTPSAAVLRCVPHRAPILRVHTVVANDGTTAHVRGAEPAGPGALPWALGAIEGLAQSGAVLLAHAAGDRPAASAPRDGMLVAVKDFAVSAVPPPGATIDYHVQLVRRLGPNVRLRGRAECAGTLLAAGECTLWTGDAGH